MPSNDITTHGLEGSDKGPFHAGSLGKLRSQPPATCAQHQAFVAPSVTPAEEEALSSGIPNWLGAEISPGEGFLAGLLSQLKTRAGTRNSGVGQVARVDTHEDVR